MLEELLIQIRAEYDGGGFTQAKDDIAALNDTQGQFTDDTVAGMTKAGDSVTAFSSTAGDFRTDSATNFGAASDYVNQFSSDTEAATLQMEEGFNPALAGMDLAPLSQLGVEMGMMGSNTEETTGDLEESRFSVNNLTDAFSSLQGVGGMALMMLGTGALALANNMMSVAKSVETTNAMMSGTLGISQQAAEGMTMNWTQQTGVMPEQSAQGITTLGAELPTVQSGTLESVMPGIDKLATALGEPDQAGSLAQQIGMAINMGQMGEGTTSSNMVVRQLARAGIGMDQLNQAASSMGMGQFSGLSPDQQLQVLNKAIENNGKVSADAANYVNSAAGKQAIMNSEWEKFESKVGEGIIDDLYTMMPLFEKLMDALSNPVVAQVVGWILIAGGALGVLIGPLMMLGFAGKAAVDGWNMLSGIVGKVTDGIGSLRDRISSAGDAAETSAAKQGTLTTAENTTGDAASTNAGKLDTLATSETAAGDAATVEAGEQDTLAGSEAAAGEGGLLSSIGGKFSGVGGKIKGALGMGEEAEEVAGAGRAAEVGGKTLAGLGGGMAEGEEAAGAARAAGGLGILADEGGMMAMGGMGGPLGLLAMGGLVAGMGAYQGWNSTQGDTGEKAKGAVGGAVESLSMGLVNKDQVVAGENWLYSEMKKIPGGVSADLGNLKQTISKPFVDGFNTARTDVNSAFNTIKSYVGNGMNTIKADVGNGVNQVTNFFNKLPGEIVQDAGALLSAAVTDGQNIYNGIVNQVDQIPGEVESELESIGQAIMAAGSTLYNDAVQLGESIWNGIQAGLGRNSPGHAYREVLAEMNDIHGVLQDYQPTFNEEGKNLGNSIVTGFARNSIKGAMIKPATTTGTGTGTTGSKNEFNFYFDRNQNKEDAKFIVDSVKAEFKRLTGAKGK